MTEKNNFFKKVYKKLIVSCQALPDEPLHSSFIMGRMALAAEWGGAAGIRAGSISDIQEIKKTVDLPIIGIIKKDYPDSKVYITPTMAEVAALYEEGVDVIAMDATFQERPGGLKLQEFFREVRKKYPDQLFMADISNYEEAIFANKIGFDCVGSTLRGYTDYTTGVELPDFNFLGKLVKESAIPVIAEGGIGTPEDLAKVMALGVHTAVVGGAVTRPMDITKKFVEVLDD